MHNYIVTVSTVWCTLGGVRLLSGMLTSDSDSEVQYSMKQTAESDCAVGFTPRSSLRNCVFLNSWWDAHRQVRLQVHPSLCIKSTDGCASWKNSSWKSRDTLPLIKPVRSHQKKLPLVRRDVLSAYTVRKSLADFATVLQSSMWRKVSLNWGKWLTELCNSVISYIFEQCTSTLTKI